ncbi:MAG: YihA family ribosome biogenesis GTP-binding protein, partial [Syntrophomonadaceae bacterium]|nr:YihA family ribosome biogenesis GTP-binding protein [Syntrophomonadaceae bacterium]
IPFLPVATKADKISKGSRSKHLGIIKKGLVLDQAPLCFSAETGEGMTAVAEAIEEIIAPVVSDPALD